MPLTAFSISRPGEFDAQQILQQLAAETDQSYSSVDTIPSSWKTHIRSDLRCPGCFVTGAEVVRGSGSSVTGAQTRQAYFRFTTPGHGFLCEYGSPETANSFPENLVKFGESKSALTLAVRDLVCTGIEASVFDQSTIAEMRRWFYTKKLESSFIVNLDFRLGKWIRDLSFNSSYAYTAQNENTELTAEKIRHPKFKWVRESSKLVADRYHDFNATLKRIIASGVFLGKPAGKRAMVLARRHFGNPVFDPAVLSSEYGKAVELATHIVENYKPLKYEKANAGENAVMAFAALLLFVSDWDLASAEQKFGEISVRVGHADKMLGNVMGLNPFHDYEAWRWLKKLQELDIAVPAITDIKAERLVVENELRAKFGIPPREI